MTRMLFLEDAYLRRAPARVTGVTGQGGLVLDASLFYATGGGQPGDSGRLEWEGGTTAITTTIKGEDGAIILVPAEGAALPPSGAEVTQHVDWDRRFGHMRIHTALHLLSVVVPLPVTGGSVSPDRGRLDFDMDAPPEDKEALAEALNRLVDENLDVTESWITKEELDANPGLVKTMSVQPPRGAGRIRLVRIGDAARQVDLQPCGGTHVARTGEVGRMRIGKIEKKGARNRRIYLHLDT